MHKLLIMSSKLHILKRNKIHITTKAQSFFECEITEMYIFFEKRQHHGKYIPKSLLIDQSQEVNQEEMKEEENFIIN